MKIASWNVNSIRARLDQVLDWIERNEPDVLCLQETKVTDQEFPEDEIADLDYDVAYVGQLSYNGVAIATLDEASDVTRGFVGEPADADKRVIALTVGGVKVICIYAPNGKSMDSPDLPRKLEWYATLLETLKRDYDPTEPLVICGDFNIAPAPIDAYDADTRVGGLFMSDGELAAFQSLLDWGLTDAFRHLHPDAVGYTWWHHLFSGFFRDAGLRIDHFLVTAPLVDRIRAVTIDREARGAENASDHAPVVLELTD